MEEQHRPLWDAEGQGHRHPPLTGEIEVDVAVIGAGVTGLTAALLLRRAGKRVAVLERERVAAGDSGCTTAHLTELLDERYFRLRRDFGRKGAALARQAQREAIERIAALVGQLGADCDFARLPGYLYAEDLKGSVTVRRELGAAPKVGLAAEPSQVPLPFPVKAGLVVEDQARLHPLKYLRALAAAFVREDGLLFEGSRVTQVREGAPCTLETEGGGRVRAAFVLDCAHAPVSTRIQPYTRQAAYRSYALALRVADPPPDALYWDTANPYHYTRLQPSADGPWVIVGGEDHKTGTRRDTEACFQSLESYARERFEVREVGFRWSGQVYETVDGLPYVGKAAGHPHVLLATGFAGNGITWGTAAAGLLADLVLGRANPLATLLSPARLKPVASARDFVRENVENGYHFVIDRLRPPEAVRPEQVAAGEGKIALCAGKKAALYRDEQGGLHALSPVCPHLGCHVAWNGAERTWDCPCHGSRFQATGEVIQGPARSGLAPLEGIPAEEPEPLHPPAPASEGEGAGEGR